MHNDSLLVGKTLEGDGQAFSQLVERYKGPVYALALQYTSNFHDAQDLAQEAFLKAYSSLSTLKDHRKFGPWLLKIAANVCKMQVRKRLPSFLDIDELERKESKTANEFLLYDEPEFSNIELRDLLAKALQSLTPSEQEVYTLYFIDNYTYREIAKALGVPMGTVKRRLHEVRKKMQKEILIMTSEHGILKYNIGLETLGRKFTTLIKKGTPLPASRYEIFTTAEDNQTAADVHVLEGNSENIEECRSLGHIKVKNFSIGPRGVPQISVTFEIDEKGMLTVSAKEPPDNILAADKSEPMQVTVEK
jgi:RNA polymerase sigma-70 factor (ECF subfamily)